MRATHSSRYFSAVALVSLLVILLLPTQSASAGGCCFTEISIKNLATGREVVISGPALTSGYDLSNFGSFADFPNRTDAPHHLGPGYEVIRYYNQSAWDHLRYYPGMAGVPGAVYYEGLINGASEYDDQWFAVTPAQDAALRQVLANRGFTTSPGPQSLLPLTVVALAAFSLIPLIGARRSRTRLTAALVRLNESRAESEH